MSETRDLHIQVTDAQAEVLLLVLAEAEYGLEKRGLEYRLLAGSLTTDHNNAAKALQKAGLIDSMSLGNGSLKNYGLTTNGRAVAQTVRALREKAGGLTDAKAQTGP